MEQTTTGKNPRQAWAHLGVPAQGMEAPPEKILAIVLGLSGSGKSSFLWSNPDAFVFNLDQSSATTQTAPCMVWPGIDREGRLVDENGGRLILTQEAMDKKVAQLVDAAEKDLPRPATIVIDSMTAWMLLLKPWVADKYNRASFKDLDGRISYPVMYEKACEIIYKLKQAGYGVYIVLHLVEEAYTDETGGNKVVSQELTVTNTFWAQLFPNFELVVTVAKVAETVTEEKVLTATVNGREAKTKKQVTRDIERHYLAFRAGKAVPRELANILKARRPKGKDVPVQIELPAENAWEYFVKAYRGGLTPDDE